MFLFKIPSVSQVMEWECLIYCAPCFFLCLNRLPLNRIPVSLLPLRQQHEAQQCVMLSLRNHLPACCIPYASCFLVGAGACCIVTQTHACPTSLCSCSSRMVYKMQRSICIHWDTQLLSLPRVTMNCPVFHCHVNILKWRCVGKQQHKGENVIAT
jgi:hypothetical protein